MSRDHPVNQSRDERLSADGPESAPAKPRAAASRRPQVSRQMSAEDDPENDLSMDDGREGIEQLEDLTDDERFDFFVQSYDNSVLPDLPELSGYHICWLTTTNPRDPIARRIRMGYMPIRAEDLGPGWSDTGVKNGDYAGVVGINEMIAAKIPIGLYQRYMRELHHTRPLSDEEKLRANLDLAKERAASFGGKLLEGDGMAQLVQRAPVPKFAA